MFWVHLAGFLLGVFYAGLVVSVVFGRGPRCSESCKAFGVVVFWGLLLLLSWFCPSVVYDSIVGFLFGVWSILWAGEDLDF